MWYRRVIVAEEVVVSPKCQYDVPVRTHYGDLTTISPAWMTEAKEIQPGDHRVVVGDDADKTQVRVVNLNEDPIRLVTYQVLGGLLQVELEHSWTSNENKEPVCEASSIDLLLVDLPEGVTVDTS